MDHHSLVEHTGELEFHVEARTLEGLFLEAARALGRIMGRARADSEPEPIEPVTLAARDRNALLAEWLNELIFLSDRDKRLFEVSKLELVNERALRAWIVGREVAELKRQVKAATMHRLDILESARGFQANVVLDV